MNMAIENGPGGTTITGEHIELYRLLALKQALKLQAKGIRISRSTTATKVAAAEMGVKRTNVPAALRWVELKLKEWEGKYGPHVKEPTDE